LPDHAAPAHAQRLKDALLHEFFQRRLRNGLHHKLEQADSLTRIRIPRSRLKMDSQFAVVLKPPPVGKPAGVAQQHAGRHALVARIIRQIGIIRVFRQWLGQILVDRLVQIKHAFIYQLQYRVGKRHFGQ
jgi:hypothetical protein